MEDKTEYEKYLEDEKKFTNRFKSEQHKLIQELKTAKIPEGKERKIVKNNLVFYIKKYLKKIGIIKNI